MNKVKLIFTSPIEDTLLLFEAFLYLALASQMKKRPFTKLAPSLGKQHSETTEALNEEHRRHIKRISNAIQIMSDYTWWESKCLVRAIAGLKMLERRGIESTLYLATAKDETGQLIAHAWLRSGPFYLSGSEEMDQFTVVEHFANLPVERKKGVTYG